MRSSEAFSRTPRRLRKDIIGHQFVNADCMRFRPTNGMNQRKYGCTRIPSNTLAATKAPQ